MTPALNLSDVVLIRSASYDKDFICGVAQTPPPASACPACARANRTRVSDRDLQALRPTQLSLRRRAWPRAQAIFVDYRELQEMLNEICAINAELLRRREDLN